MNEIDEFEAEVRSKINELAGSGKVSPREMVGSLQALAFEILMNTSGRVDDAKEE